nr:hypothetical protein [Desulfurococcales archaeon]
MPRLLTGPHGTVLAFVGLLVTALALSSLVSLSLGEGYRVYGGGEGIEIPFTYVLFHENDTAFTALPGQLVACIALSPGNSTVAATLTSTSYVRLLVEVSMDQPVEAEGRRIVALNPGSQAPLDLAGLAPRGTFVFSLNFTLLDGLNATRPPRLGVEMGGPVLYGPSGQEGLGGLASAALLGVLLVLAGVAASRRWGYPGLGGWTATLSLALAYALVIGAAYGLSRPYEGTVLCTGAIAHIYSDRWTPSGSESLHSTVLGYLAMESILGSPGVSSLWLFLSTIMAAMAWGMVFESGVDVFEALAFRSRARIFAYKVLMPLGVSVAAPLASTIVVPLALYGFSGVLAGALAGASVVVLLASLSIAALSQSVVALAAVLARRASIALIASGIISLTPLLSGSAFFEKLSPVLDPSGRLESMVGEITGQWQARDTTLNYGAWLAEVAGIAVAHTWQLAALAGLFYLAL